MADPAIAKLRLNLPGLVEVKGNKLFFDPKRIRPDGTQPRQRFRKIEELGQSIKASDQKQPAKIYSISGDPQHDYQLEDGERRWRACLLAQVSIWAIVVQVPEDPLEILVSQVLSNMFRENHDVLEVAKIVGRLYDGGKTYEEIARIFGHNAASWASQHHRLLKLDSSVQAKLVVEDEEAILTDEEMSEHDLDSLKPPKERRYKIKGKLTLALALLLLPLPHELQVRAADHIVEHQLNRVQARRLILAMCRKSGHPTGTIKTEPSKVAKSLGTLISTVRDQVGIYIDMKGPEFRAVLSSLPSAARAKVLEDAQLFKGDLNILVEEFGRVHADLVKEEKRKERLA